METIKVYIYGAGIEYRRLRDFSSPLRDRLEILGIVTTEDIGVNFIDGYPVMRPTEMDQSQMDYVVLAAGAWKEMAEHLMELGVDGEKIVRSYVFYTEAK